MFSEEMQKLWGDDLENKAMISDHGKNLDRWIRCLPDPIHRQINIALEQEQPFMPPNVTPEKMAEKNETIASMSHLDIVFVSTLLLLVLFSFFFQLSE